MSSFNDHQVKSYIAGETLAAYIRVKKSGSGVVAAGAGEAAIGVTIIPATSGDAVSVRLFNAFGTVLMTASAAITANAAVYGTASGKIDDTGSGPVVGYAEEAATANGDVIEVLIRGVISADSLAGASQAAVVASSTNGAIASVNSTAVNPTKSDFDALLVEAEKVGDDARAAIVLANALRTALIANGTITGAA